MMKHNAQHKAVAKAKTAKVDFGFVMTFVAMAVSLALLLLSRP